MSKKRLKKLPVCVEDDEFFRVNSHLRPKLRGDCLPGGANECRPCVWVSCRHHLYMEINEDGAIIPNFADKDVDDIPETCSLDIADRVEAGDKMVLERTGEFFDLTRERIRQIELDAFAKIAKAHPALADLLIKSAGV